MKHVKFLLTATMIVAFASGAVAQTTTPKAAGSDTDKHGCKGSAGYTYSVIKNDCVRLFEEKIQLKEVAFKKSYTSDAVVILSQDERKAELFLPSSAESIILSRTSSKNAVVYKKGKYVLTRMKDTFTLKKSSRTIFKS